MYALDNDTYRLYQTAMTDMNNWKEVTLSGFPAGAVLSQITDFEGDLYVISDEGALFRSVDGQVWSQIDDAPTVKTLLGCLPENTVLGRGSVLMGIVAEGNKLHFASMNKGAQWNTGIEVPESFPISGFCGFNYDLMYHPRLMVVSGRDSKNNLTNKTWSTIDGLSWASISGSNIKYSSREGAALTYYDNMFFLLGGIDASGEALSDIYFSKDYGITWSSDTMYYKMPEDYTARGYSSAFADENNYLMLFGGKAGKDTNILNELWRGRINRLGFGKE